MRCPLISALDGYCSARKCICSPGDETCKAVIWAYCMGERKKARDEISELISRDLKAIDAVMDAMREEKERRKQAQSAQDKPEA